MGSTARVFIISSCSLMLFTELLLASESSTINIHSSERPWWSKNCFKHKEFWVFWMSLRQVSRCSIVSTRTMSLQSEITAFSPYKPSPFSCRASSSSSNVVRALSVSFFRERSLCFFPPAARTLTRVSPPIKPRQLGAPQKHFWASLPYLWNW